MADGHDHRYSDAANRCADQIRMHILAGKAGKWAAVRLSDGGSDGIAYDRRADAVSHQLHEFQCAYVAIPPDNMTPKEAEFFLQFNRELYDAGMRMSDPEAEYIMPTRVETLSPLRARTDHVRPMPAGTLVRPTARRTRGTR